MTDFVVIDLREVLDKLDSHYSAASKDEYRTWCPVCEEYIEQTMDTCPGCGVPVVWRSSRAWKNLYGSPEAAIRQLSMPEPDEDDDLGRWLLGGLGRVAFANLSEKKRWDRVRKRVSAITVRDRVHYLFQHHRRNRKAIMPHLLNWCEKTIREMPRPRRERPREGRATIPLMEEP